MELFQKLRANFVGLTGGSEECSAFLLGRGSAATSGVEGFFTPDGVQIAHMFLWRAKGPKHVVDMINHFLVSGFSRTDARDHGSKLGLGLGLALVCGDAGRGRPFHSGWGPYRAYAFLAGGGLKRARRHCRSL